jgi:hypothetical protein
VNLSVEPSVVPRYFYLLICFQGGHCSSVRVPVQIALNTGSGGIGHHSISEQG